MKLASSIRFGGELIAAIDCDYEDYKYLGLLCPECKEPVFLRAGGTRISGDKEVKISPHFCHFQTKDPELAKVCEQRVGGYTQAEIDKRAAQARGQRLKILQKQFESIIDSSAYFKEAVPGFEHIEKLSNGFHPLGRYILFSAKTIASSFRKQAENAKKTALVVVNDLDDKDSSEELENLLATIRPLDRCLHKKIVLEVIDFVFLKQNKRLLTILIVYIIGQESLNDDSMHLNPKKINQIIANRQRIFFQVFAGLSLIPWADEFAKLQKQSEVKAK